MNVNVKSKLCDYFLSLALGYGYPDNGEARGYDYRQQFANSQYPEGKQFIL